MSLTRRGLLKAGGLGFAGLSLADLLRLESRAGADPGASPPCRSVILIWLDGGPPQHETYDPKPEAPSEFRGPLAPISTAVPGVQIGELLPEHARLMGKMSLIRSYTHETSDHFAAAHWVLTGYLGANALNQTPVNPSFGSVVSRVLGPARPGLPAYVGLPNTHSVGIKPGYHGAAYLGRAFDPFLADGDPNDTNYRVPELTLPGGLDPARLGERAGLLQALDGARRAADGRGDLDAFSRRAFEMLTGPEARLAFDLSHESPHLRDRYWRHQWGQSALLARRLVEAGVRFVTLTFGGWDYHSSLESGMKNVLPVLDRAVATLVDDLDQRGLLESTMVVVLGEFGRTPKMNTTGVPGIDPVPGRDHWGPLMSVLAAGGGLRPGVVVGSSTPRGEYPLERPVRPADLMATIYRQLGIDPEVAFLDRVGRPVTIIPAGGEPIRELI